MTTFEAERKKVMLAARARGWSYEQIANAAGVSHQRVHQIIGVHKISRPKGSQQRHVVRSQLLCHTCGKRLSRLLHETQDSNNFCSHKCFGLSKRQISSSQVVEAINLRERGALWKDVGEFTNATVQGIQTRIWLYLHSQGMLTHKVVEHIWSRRPTEFQKKWGVRWLEKTSGISPTGEVQKYPRADYKKRRKKTGLPRGVILQNAMSPPAISD